MINFDSFKWRLNPIYKSDGKTLCLNNSFLHKNANRLKEYVCVFIFPSLKIRQNITSLGIIIRPKSCLLFVGLVLARFLTTVCWSTRLYMLPRPFICRRWHRQWHQDTMKTQYSPEIVFPQIVPNRSRRNGFKLEGANDRWTHFLRKSP